MGTRGTIILAVLVLLGGAYLLYEGPPPEERPEPPTLLGEPRGVDPTQPLALLLEFAPGEITQVVLRWHGTQRVTSRQGSAWTGVSRPGAIDDFLDSFAGLAELMRLDQNTEESSEYGLDPPQAEIELHRASGAPLVLLLGDRNPSTTGAYVRVGRTGHVALAGALVLWEFEKAYRALGD